MFLMAFTANGTTPVILDTDIGDDIDDTWALCMLLGMPELDVKLIVTASDDTPSKTRLAAKILEAVGRTDVPLATGKKTSDRPLNQSKWLGDYSLDGYSGVVHEDGVGELIAIVKASPDPVTIIVLGPQTNLAAALERDASIASNAQLAMMAGSIRIGYDGKSEPQPEWNVYRDVAAARAVFAAPWKITMAPLDVCGTLVLEGPAYESIANSSHARARTVIANYDQWSNRSKHPPSATSVLFDTVAVYLARDTAWCTMEELRLSVNDAGATIEDPKGRPVHCATGWKNRGAFEALLVRSLTQD
jgi:inosine-uridine nucleoside N-ribohydrolase